MLKIIAWPAYKNRKGNPYNYLLYTNIEKSNIKIDEFVYYKLFFRTYDIWHIHWPEKVFTSSSKMTVFVHLLSLYLAIAIARLRKIKIIWTIHNLNVHEKKFRSLDRFLKLYILCFLNGAISLTESSLENAIKNYPRLKKIPSCVIPHGHYRDSYPNQFSKEKAKQLLDIPESSEVICFLGAIREYKNIPTLIESFIRLNEKKLYLTIAGNPQSEVLKEKIIQKKGYCNNVLTRLAHIAEQEIQIYMKSASIVVLPFKDISNSGSAILALSFNRPIVVPEKGSMRELKESIGSEWIFTYKGSVSEKVLSAALRWYKSENRAKIAPLQNLDWNKIAKETVDFYSSVLN
jgi:glycosyltransferase involved in cell wall biosynthesis